MSKVNKKDRWRIVFIASLLLIVLLTATSSYHLIGQYDENVKQESANHLLEISSQIAGNIKEEITYNWNIAEAIVSGLSVFNYQSDEQLVQYLKELCEIYELQNMIVYNQDGFTLTTRAQSKHNDLAADLIYNAMAQGGRDMAIMKSTVTYTLTFESQLTLKGAPLVGISVVEDLETFLDRMDITAFHDSAYIYLTQANGSKISQTTANNAPMLYNAYTFFEDKKAEPIICKHDFDGTVPLDETCAFYIFDDEGSYYAICNPIEMQEGVWRLFYIISADAVNQASQNFSHFIASLCAIILLGFLVLGGLLFVLLYRKRTAKYNQDIQSRNRMMDLMVNQTRNAFALTPMQGGLPFYLSSNAKDIIHTDTFRIEHKKGMYQITDAEGHINKTMAGINKELMKWDGKAEFISEFIPYFSVEGEERYFVLRLYPDAEEENNECVVIVNDVTRDKKREEKLLLALHMADSANSAKTQFLSNMSHDIRTPMNAIINMTDFAIENRDKPQEQEQYLQTIKSSAHHLLRLINDILDMSRIESGRTTLEHAPFSLEDTLSNVVEMIQPLCRNKALSFSASYDALKDISVLGDKLKLTQILINVINNAVKFTPELGEVSLSAEPLPSTQANGIELQFVIRDTGIGMSAEVQKHIFEPFMRSDNEDANKIEGTGLGLSICQSFVTAMGGTISCESVQGKGSTFTIRLPFEKTAQVQTHKKATPAAKQTLFAGKHALVCEDHKLNQTIARRILQSIGLTVDFADDGTIGLEKFLQSKDHYDLIYMDIQMPNMNGYVTAHNIRQSTHPQAKTIPILAMTANVFAEDVEKARVAGMNGHIAKPLVLEEIIRETTQAIEQSHRTGE